MILKARSPFHIELTDTEGDTPTQELPVFTCADTVISGLAIDSYGNVTNPTVTVGTFHSIDPSDFNQVYENVTHNVTVYITTDETTHTPPYKGISNELRCVVQVIQPETAETISTNCKEWTVYNNSSQETMNVYYYDCANVLTTNLVGVNATMTICVYPQTVPWVSNQFLGGVIETDTTCT